MQRPCTPPTVAAAAAAGPGGAVVHALMALRCGLVADVSRLIASYVGRRVVVVWRPAAASAALVAYDPDVNCWFECAGAKAKPKAASASASASAGAGGRPKDAAAAGAVVATPAATAADAALWSTLRVPQNRSAPFGAGPHALALPPYRNDGQTTTNTHDDASSTQYRYVYVTLAKAAPDRVMRTLMRTNPARAMLLNDARAFGLDRDASAGATGAEWGPLTAALRLATRVELFYPKAVQPRLVFVPPAATTDASDSDSDSDGADGADGDAESDPEPDDGNNNNNDNDDDAAPPAAAEAADTVEGDAGADDADDSSAATGAAPVEASAVTGAAAAAAAPAAAAATPTAATASASAAAAAAAGAGASTASAEPARERGPALYLCWGTYGVCRVPYPGEPARPPPSPAERAGYKALSGRGRPASTYPGMQWDAATRLHSFPAADGGPLYVSENDNVSTRFTDPAVVARPNGTLYFVGGYTTRGVAVERFQSFDCSTRLWTANAHRRLPVPRWHRFGYALHRDDLVLVGGTDVEGALSNARAYLRVCYAYSFRARQWRKLPDLPPLPHSARHGLTTPKTRDVAAGVVQPTVVSVGVGAGARLLVFGGRYRDATAAAAAAADDDDHDVAGRVLMLSADESQWIPCAPLPAAGGTPSPAVRAFAAASYAVVLDC